MLRDVPHPLRMRSLVPARRRTTGDSGERGFTLLEIMIALVLFSIAAALVTSVFVNALGGSGASRTGAVSDAAIERTTAALRDDVARAITEDRANSRLRDPSEFQSAVRTNAVARSTDPETAGATLDIDDVVVATPTQLALRVDAASTAAGVECV
ncbi:MAG: hypothetical protein JWM25_381, partial [Thermoleophilia bacterium]|nr:hypothetical protein [Thermoleophilia bacterium]